jgi:CBS domain-containing protein
VRQGGVAASSGWAHRGRSPSRPGELFPVSAVLGTRAVTATYKASGDTFCLRVPAATVRALVAESAPFADFVNRRMLQLLELSQRALQGSFASRALAEQSLERRWRASSRRRAAVGAAARRCGQALQADARAPRRVGAGHRRPTARRWAS